MPWAGIPLGLPAGDRGSVRDPDAGRELSSTAEAQEPLEGALARLQECRCHTLPVLSDHRLDGVLTLDNVGEFVMIETALRAAAATRSSP